MKTVVITGATSGIGLAAARKLTAKGFNVIGIGHSAENCERACAAVREAVPDGTITYYSADLQQQREVNRLADELTQFLEDECGGELFTLINNAGCVRSWYATTEEGYEQQFALNHLAGFLLTYRLMPYIEKAKGRVIMTCSNSHKGTQIHWKDVMLRDGYNPLKAYKQSKLCNILFAKELNNHYGQKGVCACAVDPGLVKTDIGSKQTGGLVSFVWKLRKKHGVSPEIPAETYLWLCEQESSPKGLYYYLCGARRYSRQVTDENAARLFSLSERLCGVKYGGFA
ncbi:MAG: SDR family NAD(P)-dependent oxidoreductase [Clostridia bacterium]|nr:SDR family NAD(P)-dependent oxidoreductase [Clostridia bacterium]